MMPQTHFLQLEVALESHEGQEVNDDIPNGWVLILLDELFAYWSHFQ